MKYTVRFELQWQFPFILVVINAIIGVNACLGHYIHVNNLLNIINQDIS
jgi:hypothetical protein